MQKNIVYLIGLIILITLSIQAYWNIINYQSNKVLINNEVLTAFDNSVNSYYTNLAKSDIKTAIIDSDLAEKDNGIDVSGKMTQREKFNFLAYDIPDKSGTQANISPLSFASDRPAQGVVTIATQIIVSLSNEKIDFDNLAKHLDTELKRKGFEFEYALSETRNFRQVASHGNLKSPELKLTAQSKSAYLPPDTDITMYYPNINLIALKESAAGLLLSFLFTLSLITCLLYLLRIIRQQKQIAAAKNDFISNISHELKTPIATSMSALEAVQHFNETDDVEKTSKYMGIAEEQLLKLSVMVEKILDTVSLDSEELILYKETTDIVPLLAGIVEKQQIKTGKHIVFITDTDTVQVNIDVFHFENVINNIIENAVKYGGDIIKVTIIPEILQPGILVSDNGTPIERSERSRIFEKFYRISTQNIHDIKGYGIGLYYSKNIIEKHGGKLVLDDNTTETIFKITVPYV